MSLAGSNITVMCMTLAAGLSTQTAPMQRDAASDPASHQPLMEHSRDVGFNIALPATERVRPTSKGKGVPMLIGFHRDVPDAMRGNLLPSLDWVQVGDDSAVAVLWVSSPDAASIRVGIKAHLPEGAEVRFFDPDDEALMYMVTRDDFHYPRFGERRPPGALQAALEPEILWSHSVDGDTMGVEIMLPSRQFDASWFRVEKIAHRWHTIRPNSAPSLEMRQAKYGRSVSRLDGNEP